MRCYYHSLKHKVYRDHRDFFPTKLNLKKKKIGGDQNEEIQLALPCPSGKGTKSKIATENYISQGLPPTLCSSSAQMDKSSSGQL